MYNVFSVVDQKLKYSKVNFLPNNVSWVVAYMNLSRKISGRTSKSRYHSFRCKTKNIVREYLTGFHTYIKWNIWWGRATWLIRALLNLKIQNLFKVTFEKRLRTNLDWGVTFLVFYLIDKFNRFNVAYFLSKIKNQLKGKRLYKRTQSLSHLWNNLRFRNIPDQNIGCWCTIEARRENKREMKK